MRESTVRGPAIDLGEFERRLRAPERKAGAADPLNELARLMQGEEAAAADPYSRILAEPHPVQPVVPGPPPELRGSYEEAPPVAIEPQYEEQHDAYYEPTVDQQHYAEPSFADARPAYSGAEGEWSDDEQYLDYGDEVEQRQERRGLGRWLRPWHAVAAISLIAIGSIGWGFAHRTGAGGSKEIATITAPEGPVKVKPTAETEANAPDASGAAVLDRKEGDQVKQVVNNQEQAVEPVVVPKAVTLGNGPVAAPHEPALPGMPTPKKVKPVTVRPDGTRIDDAEALPPAVSKATRPAPPAEPPVAEKTATPPGAPAKTTTPKVAKPKTPPAKPAKVAAAQADAAAPPAEANDAPAEPAAAAAPVSKGGYAVQFGAAGSEAEAKAMIKSVSAKYGASLGGYKPSFYQATVGEKTVYRVRVGGVSKDSAAAICGKVKASGGNCFIAGN